MTQVVTEKYNPNSVLKTFALKYNSLGKEAVGIMNSAFKGNNNVTLDTAKLAEGYPIARLNLYQAFALGQIVSQITGYNARLLTPAYLQLLRAIGYIGIGNAQDLAVVAYPSQGPNEEIRGHLIAQAAERGVQLTNPEAVNGSKDYLPIVFHNIEVIPDGKFPHGARLDMGETGVAYPPKYSSMDPELIKSGFPAAMTAEGDRMLALSRDGLRRVFVDDKTLYACGSMLTFPDVSAGLTFINVPQNLIAGLEKILKGTRSLADLSEERLTQLVSGLI